MTKSTIRSNLSSFTPDITASRAKGLDYVLGETNSYSCHVSIAKLVFHCALTSTTGCSWSKQYCRSCIVGVGLFIIRVCTVLASSVYDEHATNVNLRTQIGISRVFFHEGVGYKYNMVGVSLLAYPNTPVDFYDTN